LTPLLLWLLAERESYGYELVQRLRGLGLTSIPDGTVYPALARLEREGRANARLVPSDRLRTERTVWALDFLLADLPGCDGSRWGTSAWSWTVVRPGRIR
jgi:Predicted transcriptional regulators